MTDCEVCEMAEATTSQQGYECCERCAAELRGDAAPESLDALTLEVPAGLLGLVEEAAENDG